MAFVLIAITFFACRKDLEMDLLDADPNVEFRNDSDSTSVDSTNTVPWKSPNSAQFTMVYQDFMSKPQILTYGGSVIIMDSLTGQSLRS